MTNAVIWNKGTLCVRLGFNENGDLRFDGQDLFAGREYEYAFVVSRTDIPKLVAALGGEPGQDVIKLIQANAEAIIKQGEHSWVKSVGIDVELSTRYGD